VRSWYNKAHMAGDSPQGSKSTGKAPRKAARATGKAADAQAGGQAGAAPQPCADRGPAWAAPLRHMYDEGVSEPLPPDLADLLARLDSTGE